MPVKLLPLFLFALTAMPQPAGLGQGWLPEFDHAASQIQALAEAIPAEKYSWRPSPGVRSVSEVLMHVALGNYYLLDQAGAKIPDDTPPIAPDLEKKTEKKEEVIRWLQRSFDAVRRGYATTDRTRKRQFFGKPSTAEHVFLRMLVHNHEHMGQVIAYARTIGLVPPWTEKR